jgi:phosphoribosylanthranilate isomerase
MLMTKVKICGLMEPEDVQTAVNSGADAVGFVFAPSRRQLTVETAKELASAVPNEVLKIGVFVNETLEEVERIAKEDHWMSSSFMVTKLRNTLDKSTFQPLSVIDKQFRMYKGYSL